MSPDVDAIYEAAFIPELWPGVLDRLCRMTESWGAALIAVDARQRYRFVATEAYRPLIQAFADRSTEYRNIRLERSFAKRHQGFMADLDVCTEEELSRDPIYTDFLRPAGLGWTAGTVLPIPSGDVLIFDLDRTIERGPFETAAIACLDRVRPDLARAGFIAARLGLDRARVAAEILSMLGIPGGVLAADGRLVAANAEFESLQGYITIGPRDVVRFMDRSADTLFAESIAQFGHDVSVVRSVPVAATETHPAAVFHLIPVRRQAHDLFGSADALLTVTPIEAPASPSGEMLNALFDLTAAEANLARAIAGGATLKQAAAQFGLSELTLRGRLKSVFAKTGTSRQSELVRLLLGATPRMSLEHPRRSDSAGDQAG